MLIPYKVTALSPNTPVIVGNTDFQNHVIGINTSMAWAELLPGITTAIQQYVIDFLGLPFYNDLVGKHNAGTILTTEQDQALEYLQQAAANYAVYHMLPHKLTILASSGVVQNSPDGGSQSTSQWAYHERRLNLLATADASMERLLNYLSQQTAAYFDLWKNNIAATYKAGKFIKTATDLDEYLNIKRSHRTFISLVSFLKRAEEDVQKIVCTTLYAALTGASVSGTNAKLIPYIKKIVAYRGAEYALPHHRVVIDGDGFRVVSQTDGTTDRRNLTNNVHEAAVGALLDTYKRLAGEAVNDLIAFLEANIADYPDYASSTCRTVTVGRETTMYASDDLNGAIGIL